MGHQTGKEKTVKITEAEWFELQKQALLHKLETELGERIKKRFFLAILVIGVASFFGIQGIASIFINKQLEPQIEKAKIASIKSELEAKQASLKLSNALKDVLNVKEESEEALYLAKKNSQEVKKLLDSLGDQADDLENRITKVQATSENVRTQLEISIAKLESRFGGAFMDHDKTAKEAISVREELSSFKENSEYNVNVNVYGITPTPKAEEIVQSLRLLGFNVSDVNISPLNEQENENKTNEATISHTTKGHEKLDLVLSEINKINGLKSSSPRKSGDDLAGDIQINFQPKY